MGETTATPKRRLSRGELFRRRVLRDYELDPAELELLAEAVRVLDSLEGDLDPREYRLRVDLLRKLLASLGLSAAEDPQQVSERNRKAARKRWSRVTGWEVADADT